MSGKPAKAKRKSVVETAEQRRELDAVTLRDDVSWWTSLVTSAISTDWEPTVGLSILPQVARVLHEGLDQLKRVDPGAVDRVTAGWDVDIATARHTVKLLDDDKRSVDSVLDQAASIGDEHTATFLSLNDFALLESDGRALASTPLASYQAAASLNDRWTADKDSRSFNLGPTRGQRTVELQRAFGMGRSRYSPGHAANGCCASPRRHDSRPVLLLMVERSVDAAL